MRTIVIGEVTIELHASGLTVTKFADGGHVHAWPEDTDAYRTRAVEMGYGADVFAMSRDHELAHTLIARTLGLSVSPVLWAIAHDEPPPSSNDYEEAAVLALQHFARLHGIDLVAVLSAVA